MFLGVIVTAKTQFGEGYGRCTVTCSIWPWEFEIYDELDVIKAGESGLSMTPPKTIWGLSKKWTVYVTRFLTGGTVDLQEHLKKLADTFVRRWRRLAIHLQMDCEAIILRRFRSLGIYWMLERVIPFETAPGRQIFGNRGRVALV